MRCFLSLGSNLGDRIENLRSALRQINRLPATRLEGVSHVYETSPVGVRRQRDFLNLCARIETDLSPSGLLIEIKRIEALLGRRPGPRWGPRPADIDILMCDAIRLRSRLLRIPHPRVLRRRFVLVPLAEIFPRARRWLRRLNEPSQNVKLIKELQY